MKKVKNRIKSFDNIDFYNEIWKKPQKAEHFSREIVPNYKAEAVRQKNWKGAEDMRRVWSVVFSLALLLQLPALAADGGGAGPWTRTEGDGSYVTIRVAAEDDLGWADSRYLAVRYADTGEPVALSSEYLDGYLFATVPAADADRPLEVFAGEPFDWTDLPSFSEPWGSNELQIRGILRGDEAGRLNRDGALTRAQAFAIMVRLLSLEPAGDPGYGDVSPSDWYYGTVSAARAAGIAAADADFRPNDKVTRAEFVVMVARAMETIGWLRGTAWRKNWPRAAGRALCPMPWRRWRMRTPFRTGRWTPTTAWMMRPTPCFTM